MGRMRLLSAMLRLLFLRSRLIRGCWAGLLSELTRFVHLTRCFSAPVLFFEITFFLIALSFFNLYSSFFIAIIQPGLYTSSANHKAFPIKLNRPTLLCLHCNWHKYQYFFDPTAPVHEIVYTYRYAKLP